VPPRSASRRAEAAARPPGCCQRRGAARPSRDKTVRGRPLPQNRRICTAPMPSFCVASETPDMPSGRSLFGPRCPTESDTLRHAGQEAPAATGNSRTRRRDSARRPGKRLPYRSAPASSQDPAGLRLDVSHAHRQQGRPGGLLLHRERPQRSASSRTPSTACPNKGLHPTNSARRWSATSPMSCGPPSATSAAG
jgi:hypothetical protein